MAFYCNLTEKKKQCPIFSVKAELVDVQYGSSEDLRRIQTEVNVTNKIALLKIGPVPLLNTVCLIIIFIFILWSLVKGLVLY